MGDLTPTSSTASVERGTQSALPVVALGASAGGLEALRELFRRLPVDTGMAFVVIQHLDPERASMLTRVLDGVTGMRVVEAADGMKLEPNRVHVIPSDHDLVTKRGVLTLITRQRTGSLHLPIDTFFHSLAEDDRCVSIGVVLSGSGADGTDGLRAIKAEGGICIAQDPGSAQFPSMPEHAISADVVDYRGSPGRIAAELARLGRHPYIAARSGAAHRIPEDEKTLGSIFASLRRHAGTDFGAYKRTTVSRRIERRMTLRRLERLSDYADLLRDDPVEAQALARDMLIHVTSFFRDPDAFSLLEQRALPELAERKGQTDSFRVWVPGCATGEEAYSIGISLLEVLGERADQIAIQIFGTDLSAEAIAFARAGVYSEPAVAGVPPERVAHYFDRVERGYRIGKRVRDRCVFVEHDLTRDPPFSKLDLISCRNLLIYLGTELQRRVIPLLHHCLNERGILFLGQSETITGFRDLFAPVDAEHRIFVKTGDSPRLVYPLPTSREAEVRLSDTRFTDARHPAREAQRQADHLLLARYAPPGVVVDERLEIVQFRGRTGAYLESPPGQPQASLLRMVREGLVAHVHEAIEQAKAGATTIRKEGVRFRLGAEDRVVTIAVVPLANAPDVSARYFLVLFEDAGTSELGRVVARPDERPAESASELGRVEAELVTTKDYLQSLIAEHQITTDDLAAANEELVAANEELQSANEELQSAKEELQSTNEELSTVNEQLRSRNLELDQVANDLVNVLASVEIPIIIVDLQLRVRRFTPALGKIASFIPEDVGRPIEDLALRIEVDDLGCRIRDVIDNVTPREWEVEGVDGHWSRMQIRPYRTADHRLDGAILSFVDVDVLKKARQDAEGARDYARAIVETVTTALVVLDASLSVVSTNRAFVDGFSRNGEVVEGASLLELGEGVWDTPVLRRALEETLEKHAGFTDLELSIALPQSGHKTVSLTGRAIAWQGNASMALLAVDDVTELRALEAERAQLLESEKRARLEAERATRAKDVFLAVLSHELRTPLSAILMSAQLLEDVAGGHPKVERAIASIERAAHAQARLIDDLLDVSRIVSGKLMLDFGPVDLAAVVQEAVDVAGPSARAKALTLDVRIEDSVGLAYGDATRLQQVAGNLLGNAIKFTPRGGRIKVELARVGDGAELTISDSGMGIPAEVLPTLFSRFVQADSSVTRTHGGLGLGLAIVRHLVEAHGGQVEAESHGEGKGATFRVTLPVGAARPEASAPRAVVRGISGVRVLLVEDDDDTREAYAAMLERFGADVRAVSSAAAGFGALGEFRPQVLLCDIAMPGEDGFTFIRRVRALAPEQGALVPAAAVTALAGDEDRQRAIQAGFQVHVAKPVDATRLASVVGTLADWARVEVPPATRS